MTAGWCAVGSAYDAITRGRIALGGGRALRLFAGGPAADAQARLGAHTAQQTDGVRVELLNWTLCIGRALQAIWQTSHLHADIKLENCLIDDAGSTSYACFRARGSRLTRLRVADMGSSLRTRAVADHRVWGVIAGTKFMLAPEARRDDAADNCFSREGEMWTLGCVSFEILTCFASPEIIERCAATASCSSARCRTARAAPPHLIAALRHTASVHCARPYAAVTSASSEQAARCPCLGVQGGRCGGNVAPVPSGREGTIEEVPQLRASKPAITWLFPEHCRPCH